MSSGSYEQKIITTDSYSAKINNDNAEAVALSLYDSLQLDKKELSFEALKYAYKGYLNLLNKGAIKRSDILTVIDFSKSSHKRSLQYLSRFLPAQITLQKVVHTPVLHPQLVTSP